MSEENRPWWRGPWLPSLSRRGIPRPNSDDEALPDINTDALSDENLKELSPADVLRVFYLVAKVLNNDVALGIVELADLNKQHCKITCDPPTVVRNREKGRVILRTNPIRVSHKGPRHFIKRLLIEVTGHDQGWASDPDAGSWTWYDAELVSTLQSDDWRSGPVVRSKIELGRNNVADNRSQHHVLVLPTQDAPPQQQQFLDLIQNGDVIEVRACALYSGWANHVEKARVEIDTSIP